MIRIFFFSILMALLMPLHSCTGAAVHECRIKNVQYSVLPSITFHDKQQQDFKLALDLLEIEDCDASSEKDNDAGKGKHVIAAFPGLTNLAAFTETPSACSYLKARYRYTLPRTSYLLLGVLRI